MIQKTESEVYSEILVNLSLHILINYILIKRCGLVQVNYSNYLKNIDHLLAHKLKN